MAKIIFRPVCDACGGVLYCNVNITQDYLKTSADNKELWATRSIEPLCCPHCGKTFDTILLPTRLPYHTDIMDDPERGKQNELH